MVEELTPALTDRRGTWKVKAGLAEMLKGGVIMDVVTPEQAKIAEDAGAVAVMALERVPADIRREGGVARMSDPGLIAAIIDAVTIPVMAKCRIGHFVEAQILESPGVDYIDESEVLTPADEEHHINKHVFKIPFGRPRQGHRGGDHVLRSAGHPCRRVQEPRQGDAGVGDRGDSPGGAARRQRLVRTRRRVGVLALQGDFREHLAALRACEVEGVPIRLAADLDAVDALILPGGESTTMARLLE